LNDIAVIGAGPAGIAAAVYLKRAGFDVNVFERKEIGGLLLNAHMVENYPGIPKGIKGTRLCRLMEEHLKVWRIKPVMEEIRRIIVTERNEFVLAASHGRRRRFRAAVLAMGTHHNELGIPGEAEMKGKRVFYETRDLVPKLEPGDRCIVVGGGDAAFDYSLSLVDENVEVAICYRSKEPRCLPLLRKRVEKKSGIRLHPLLSPVRISSCGGELEMVFSCAKNKVYMNIPSDHILIACGRTPNTELLSAGLKHKDVPGLFLAGDILSGRARQVGIAVGSGILAAIEAERYLKGC